MAFQVNETLVIQNVDNTFLPAGALVKGIVVDVADEDHEEWTAVKTSEKSYVHVAFKQDRNGQVNLVCRDIDGVVFPEDVAEVYVALRESGEPRYLVRDHKDQFFGFIPNLLGFSLRNLADLVRERMDTALNESLEEIFLPGLGAEAQLPTAVCVYTKPKQDVEQSVNRELNTVTLPCSLGSGARFIGAEIGDLYGLGVGAEDDGRGIFIDREQAAELLESLLEFIEGGE